MKESNSSKGKDAELKARRYLENLNYRIIETNWRCRRGELDIIAIDRDNYIAFIEVKYRSGDSHGTPAEAIDDKKRKQLIKLARIYISLNPQIKDSDMRFDVIEVKPEGINHLKNAFSA